MTCKDCKNRRKCTDDHKSYSYDEAFHDSWANWCDDFRSIHRTRTVRVGKHTATQTGYNWHIMILKDGAMVGHISATKRLSKAKIRKIVKGMIG